MGQGLIFVVDLSDRERVEDAQEVLMNLLAQDDARGAALLVLANKRDLPNAMPVEELTQALGLHDVHSRRWFVQSTCATTGHGLHEGLDWLSRALSATR